ncbi:MAG: MFS transporter [Actinomycetota bacterium]|nr:MFS transporter [Actinomycetota bacterium]
MTTTTTGAVAGRSGRGFFDGLVHRQLDSYPDTGPRIFYLALTVAATAVLYYELYCSASVATLQLATLHMSFTYYVTLLAVANLIGAFGSLLAGITDRLGRTNLVVIGLLVTGLMIAIVIPAANSKWTFGVATCVVGLVEGICLVATPALIRDFSPQLGRATAMGFWTMGPVLGSLIVSVVGTNTITTTTTWPTEYRIAGVVGLAMFVLAFLFMRELSPGLRDQLMVSMRDRALIEARAKGLNIEDALKNPFRQMLHGDILASAVGIAVFLLIYYTAVAFFTTYFVTTFGFSLSQANGLGNWNWGFNLIFLIVIGLASDKIRVRKPFMIIGGVGAAVMIVVFLSLATHPHTSYYHMAAVLAILACFLGIAYTPWMASFTETVESHNPALTATGLAVWGWIIRVIIFVAYIILPHVVTSTNALVNQGPAVQAAAAKYAPQVAFASAHPDVVATAQKYTTQLTDAQKFAPELAVIQAHPGLFTQLATNPTSPALQAQAVAAGGGGAQGVAILQSIATNQAAITGVIAVAPQLQTLVPFASQLTALQKAAGQPDFQYLQKNAPAVQKAAKDAPGQWQNYFWVCFGGVIVFLLTVPLMRGRWSPKKAKEDIDAHEALVQAEMAKLNA